jgi:hypothetical protein
LRAALRARFRPLQRTSPVSRQIKRVWWLALMVAFGVFLPEVEIVIGTWTVCAGECGDAGFVGDEKDHQSRSVASAVERYFAATIRAVGSV